MTKVRTKKVMGLEGIMFTDEELEQAVAENKFLNLQLAIPSGCLNDCVYCFQASGKKGKQIRIDKILDVIDQIGEMGAKYLQILGKGEPLLNKNFFTIVDRANENGVYVNLFTSGDVLGDDDLAMKIHGMTGTEIIEKLHKKDFSLFLKYEARQEDQIVNRPGYSEIRNRALDRLIEAGFNKTMPTRLGLTPVILNSNYDELRDIFREGLQQNLYPHLCILISTGKTKDVGSRTLDVKPEQLTTLCVDNIKEALRQGYDYIGPTPFPGGVHCDYLRIGLYMDNFGDVFICSGRDTNSLGNVKKDRIKDIWENSLERRRPFLDGHGCPWKENDGIIPEDYYAEVDRQITEHQAKGYLSKDKK